MALNQDYFKYVMHEHGDNIQSLAAALGVHESTLYMKTRVNDAKRKQEFKRDEIELIYKRYDLTPSELVKMFFS